MDKIAICIDTLPQISTDLADSYPQKLIPNWWIRLPFEGNCPSYLWVFLLHVHQSPGRLLKVTVLHICGAPLFCISWRIKECPYHAFIRNGFPRHENFKSERDSRTRPLERLFFAVTVLHIWGFSESWNALTRPPVHIYIYIYVYIYIERERDR